MNSDLTEIVQSCLQRVRRWRVPPRWSRHEWLDEARAQGHASGYEALREYDGSKSGCESTFVQGRVMAGILTAYRREWTLTGRTVSEESLALEQPETEPLLSDLPDAPEAPEMREAGERRTKPRGPQATPGWETADLQRVMQKLPREDQRLLRLLFWEEHSEADVALELGISQPAVNKRKQRLLRELRDHLAK